ncbi:histidinol dehydrogenase [Flavobacteriaceae bacterium]|jgi:histidinol dehydrogenase|nr:histidinol dehydrogenase [Flavobacteriaceae bacterium]MDC3334597.1 histidinol dehydrogenase [Flavobacteriaceae bacterium]
MKQIINPPPSKWESLLARPSASYDALEPIVAKVFTAIESRGDTAIREFTEEFDKVKLTDFKVSAESLAAAEDEVSAALKGAIQQAKNNISCFHTAQKTDRVFVETMKGVACWQEKRPIEKVGLYIPGGSAPLFSTLLMLAVPAKIAGCSEIVLCTPPDQKGEIPAVIRYTASLCGISQLYAVGGIQAIAAMTLGTESIPQVYKIFGPGNQYVTLAKQWATRFNVSIDMPAGPSELLVVADDSADPDFIASDLLSQAEHGPDSQVIFVTTVIEMLDKVASAVKAQLEVLPRKAIAEKALANSKMIYFSEEEHAIRYINAYGPEHYIVCVKNEDRYVSGIQNAGSVFIGNYTPESAGDYASGTNHTLPTNGYSKQYSGVNLDSFLKAITFQKISKEGIQTLGKTIELMAAAEGLEAHKNAVRIRLNKIADEN